MFKVVFLGSNPSERSSSTVPFWNDTKSLTILSGWIESIEEAQNSYFMNVANYTTPGNRPLKTTEIKAELDRLRSEIDDLGENVKIIALGKTAEKALTLLGKSYYGMPHPSGLNRLLNDKAYVEEKVNGLKNYLSAHPINNNVDITQPKDQQRA